MTTIESLKQYPEHHASWLEVMGVSMWVERNPQYRPVVKDMPSQAVSEMSKIESELQKNIENQSDVSVVNLETEQPVELAQPLELPESVVSTVTPSITLLDLPDRIQTAQFWVLGEGELTAEQLYLLAGMLKAIGASHTDVVYSYVVSNPVSATSIATGLGIWPSLYVQPIEGLSSYDLGSWSGNTRLLSLGLESIHPMTSVLPSLQKMIEQPELKKHAWQVLRKHKV